MSVLKQWVDKHFYLADFSEELIARFLDFVREAVPSKVMANSIEQALQRSIDQKCPVSHISMRDYVRSRLPATKEELEGQSLWSLDPHEIAVQMTVGEADLFRSISPAECLNQSWSKKGGQATNIRAMIQRFNRTSNWVISFNFFIRVTAQVGQIVLEQKSLSSRVTVIESLLKVANYCREMNNFNGIMEILSGLHSSAVHRLKKTWEKLSAKAKNRHETLSKLMSTSKNFKEYRETIKLCEQPILPYLGVYLTDLTFIEDGHKDTSADGKINFLKRTQLASVIQDIMQYQQLPYKYDAVPWVQQEFEGWEIVIEKVQYGLSLEVEPREAASS